MKRRRILAAVALLGLALLSVVAVAEPPSRYSYHYFDRARRWIVNQTGNYGATADTITGPSVHCFGARQVVARIRANIGVCSLAVWEVSNNDTNWMAMSEATMATSLSDLTHTDSLSQGGQSMRLCPIYGTSSGSVVETGLNYRFARIILTRKIDSAQASDTALPGRIDSLWVYYVVERWNEGTLE